MRTARRRIRLVALIAATLTGLAVTAARADLYSNEELRIYSDIRIRNEADWDSLRADGSERDNRTRLRIRFRLGFEFEASEALTLNVRLRSGPDESQQSSNITIVNYDESDGETRDTGSADFNFDRWYLLARRGALWGWIGRNNVPFWKQNELIWDDDATVAGVAGGWTTKLGANGKLAANAGFFSPPVGMRAFVGSLGVGQLVYDRSFGENVGLTAAAGLLWLPADARDSDGDLLLEGNGARDYELWVLALQGRLRAAGLPLSLGLDLVTNGKDYPGTDPQNPSSSEQFSFDNRDETDGYVVSITFGDMNEKGHWLAGWYHARIEALAVNNSYAQDDWARWGSATQSRLSNMEGNELRFGYRFGRNTNVVARLYVARAITSIENGKRLRVDLNHEF